MDYNFEYGVLIEEAKVAATVLSDVGEYSKIGSVATQGQVESYAVAVEALQKEYQSFRKNTERGFRQQFQDHYEQVSVEAIRLQVGTRSPNAIFAEAVAYLLRLGPMSTEALHPRIQELLPDLCDEQHDRVIDGRHFGKLWKHQVRSAQQHLKRAGTIVYENGIWKLSPR